jgi:hypothetical protein
MGFRFLGVLLNIRVAPLFLIGCIFGCSDGGEGNRVSGNITFQGKPVPAGKIYFIPDSSKGNAGATGWADIKEGQYDTSADGGSGAAAGPVIIAIEGIDPSGPPQGGEASEDITATVLFPRYELPADLPDGDSTKDIDVPAEAAQGPAQPNVAPTIIP